MDIFNRCVEQLAQMGASPGAVDYAKARARDLEADKSGLFMGMYAAVNARLKEIQSDALKREKRL